VRSLHPETSAQLPQWIEGIVKSICDCYGATYEFSYRRLVPSVQNDIKITKLIEKAAKEALGSDRVINLLEPSLGAEDFSLYLDHAPGSMFRLGVAHAHKTNYPLHHPKFEVDESAIAVGVVTLAYAAALYWQKSSR
jgi:amidohydrolase